MSGPVLRVLQIADPPERWAALGFSLQAGGINLGGVRVEFVPGRQGGIVSWALEGLPSEAPSSIDGLVTEALPPARAVDGVHQNGALGIDHVVVTTPDLDRTARALARAGLQLRRVRNGPHGRQGFRRLGPAILELVEVRLPDRSEPARFWGMVVIVSDLQALAQRLGEHLGRPKPAVQPGRCIATLRPSTGIGPALAFMTPET